MLLGNMTRLRVLLLTGQDLSHSELPMNMSSFLTHLDLENTRLQGELPATIFEIPNLQILRLGGNYGLIGALPKTLNWSNVHSLEVLDLSGTSISGTLPDSIGFMTSLNYMYLSQTSISGRLPDSIGFMTSLVSMDLNHCISGEEDDDDEEEESEESRFMMGFTWKEVVVGYGCGILLGFILGNVMISMEKPRWLARFVYVEAQIILRRRNNRRRMVQVRR